jgi:predicted TPR repeat methyltransferase
VPPGYLRPLSPRETLAVVRFNLGNDRREHGDLKSAATLYSRAATDFPQFAEAHASLGLTRQLMHDLDGAAAAYAAAQKIDPELPGLAENVAALARERAAAGH